MLFTTESLFLFTIYTSSNSYIDMSYFQLQFRVTSRMADNELTFSVRIRNDFLSL